MDKKRTKILFSILAAVLIVAMLAMVACTDAGGDEPEPEDRKMPLGCLWTGRKPVSVAEGPFKQNTEQAESRSRWV